MHKCETGNDIQVQDQICQELEQEELKRCKSHLSEDATVTPGTHFEILTILTVTDLAIVLTVF